MIEFVEIRNAERELVGIIDTAKSIIWRDQYFGAGDFEVYAPATPEFTPLLLPGNYVTRQENRNVGIIDRVEITYTPEDGQMIVASGSFAKSLLGLRLIYSISGKTIYPVISSGNVERAVRGLVTAHLIAPTDTARQIPFVELGALKGITKTIIDEAGNSAQKQTSFENLLTYTDGMLQEYGLGAYIGLDLDTLRLKYHVYEGQDRSIDNAAGNPPLIFSQEYDNLLSSAYNFDKTALRNTALIGGQGEGTERFCTLLTNGHTGLARREVFVDASSQSRTYKDDNDVEQTYSDSIYSSMLKAFGRQDLAHRAIVETFDAEIDLTNAGLVFGEDYSTGDIVTTQDNALGIYKNVRLLSVTEVQDDNGYSIKAEFGD